MITFMDMSDTLSYSNDSYVKHILIFNRTILRQSKLKKNCDSSDLKI